MIDQEHLRAYRLLRETGKGFHGKLLALIPRSLFVQTAGDLGLWKRGTLVADQGDTEILAERLIYDKRWQGKNALAHFEEGAERQDLTRDEEAYFQAMRSARFSLFRVREANPAVGFVFLEDCFGGPLSKALIDFGLSETAFPRSLLAMRLLDVGPFYMTSGVSFPFEPAHVTEVLRYLHGRPLGSRRNRLSFPEQQSLYFYKLHRRFGIGVQYGEWGEPGREDRV